MKSSSESGLMLDSFDDSDDSVLIGIYLFDFIFSFDSDSDDYDDSGFMSLESFIEGYIVDWDMYYYDSDMSMVSLIYSDSDIFVEVENLWFEVDSSGFL